MVAGRKQAVEPVIAVNVAAGVAVCNALPLLRTDVAVQVAVGVCRAVVVAQAEGEQLFDCF